MTATTSEPFSRRAREFRRRYQAPDGLFWIRRVNHSVGALIAFFLLPTRVTPNALTVAGVAAHIAGAVVTASLPAPAPVEGVLAVMLLWQLAFSLDCADGPLARARGRASPFGAWLDQLADSVSRTAVYIGLSVFLVRAFPVDPAVIAVLAPTAVALALLQTFSSWQRTSVIGAGSPIAETGTASRTVLRAAQQMIDYGAFLFLASILLAVPAALLVFLVLAGSVNGLFVVAQIALGWRQHRSDERERAAGP